MTTPNRLDAFLNLDPSEQAACGKRISSAVADMADTLQNGEPWDFTLFAFMTKPHPEPPAEFPDALVNLLVAGYGLTQTNPETGQPGRALVTIDPRLPEVSGIYNRIYPALKRWQNYLIELGPQGPGPFELLIVQHYPDRPQGQTNPAVMPLWSEQMQLTGQGDLPSHIEEFTNGGLAIDLHKIYHTVETAVDIAQKATAEAAAGANPVIESREPADDITELDDRSQRSTIWRKWGFDPLRIRIDSDDQTDPPTLIQRLIDAPDLPQLLFPEDWTTEHAQALLNELPGYFLDERGSFPFEPIVLQHAYGHRVGQATKGLIPDHSVCAAAMELHGLINPEDGSGRTRTYATDTAHALAAPGAVNLMAMVGSIQLGTNLATLLGDDNGASLIADAVSGRALPADHGSVTFEMGIPEEMLLGISDLDMSIDYGLVRLIIWRRQGDYLLLDLYSERIGNEYLEQGDISYPIIDQVRPYLDLVRHFAIHAKAPYSRLGNGPLLLCDVLAQLAQVRHEPGSEITELDAVSAG